VSESSSIHFWIPVEAAIFIVALIHIGLSCATAAVSSRSAGTHLLAVVVLARRNSAWGFGAGVAVAVAWNSLNLFVTHVMQIGVVEFWSFLHTAFCHGDGASRWHLTLHSHHCVPGCGNPSRNGKKQMGFSPW